MFSRSKYRYRGEWRGEGRSVLVFITNTGQSRFRAKCPTILTFNQLVYALDLGQLAVHLLYRAGGGSSFGFVCTQLQLYAAHAYSRGFNDKQYNERRRPLISPRFEIKRDRNAPFSIHNVFAVFICIVSSRCVVKGFNNQVLPSVTPSIREF